jgi:UDP-N-acetylglucosamine--N-acetylmuramyl-(pentapeptide) pyrophosphoryl-undecaprenol N-acetylglucosamine transferase
MLKQKTLIILAAGGTGGHVMPAAALARALVDCRIEWITDARGMKFETHFGAVPMHVFASGAPNNMRGIFNLGLGFIKSFLFLWRAKPVVVVGFGGYPSFMPVLAAQILGIPTIIHEQNAVLGLANKVLARRAKSIALSWPDTKGLREADKNKCIVTGNPVRAEIETLRDAPYPETANILKIFITGGSLGAASFGKIIPAAFDGLSPENRARVEIIHQCRTEDINAARAVYDGAHMNVTLAPFFDDVAAIMEKSHLLIARSGASTVAEVTVAGRPAIFVPYPHHKDQQQKFNADYVARNGGAWVIEEKDFTPEILRARIEEFLRDPAILPAAAANAKKCGNAGAVQGLCKILLDMLNFKS